MYKVNFVLGILFFSGFNNCWSDGEPDPTTKHIDMINDDLVVAREKGRKVDAEVAQLDQKIDALQQSIGRDLKLLNQISNSCEFNTYDDGVKLMKGASETFAVLKAVTQRLETNHQALMQTQKQKADLMKEKFQMFIKDISRSLEKVGSNALNDEWEKAENDAVFAHAFNAAMEAKKLNK